MVMMMNNECTYLLLAGDLDLPPFEGVLEVDLERERASFFSAEVDAAAAGGAGGRPGGACTTPRFLSLLL